MGCERVILCSVENGQLMEGNTFLDPAGSQDSELRLSALAWWSDYFPKSGRKDWNGCRQAYRSVFVVSHQQQTSPPLPHLNLTKNVQFRFS